MISSLTRRYGHPITHRPVLNLVHLKDKTVNGPQAASMLGISQQQLAKWNKRGKIKPISGPNIDGCSRNLFLRTQVELIKGGTTS